MDENKTNNILNIHSKYSLKNIFSFLEYNYVLKLLKYNKNLQKQFNIKLQDYSFSYKYEEKIVPKKNNNYNDENVKMCMFLLFFLYILNFATKICFLVELIIAMIDLKNILFFFLFILQFIYGFYSLILLFISFCENCV